MKILGIIGGTGPESTVEYYRRTMAVYRQLEQECARFIPDDHRVNF